MAFRPAGNILIASPEINSQEIEIEDGIARNTQSP
jgi:hypothetical protein